MQSQNPARWQMQGFLTNLEPMQQQVSPATLLPDHRRQLVGSSCFLIATFKN